MSTKAYKSTARRVRGNTATKQTVPMTGEKQVKNNAGGYVYEVDQFDALTRFLILGTEGGTYYVKEADLTKTNLTTLESCLKADWKRTIDLIVNVSVEGRAAKNDAAIFALAVASASDNDEARAYALAQVSKVCRIPTHLFHYVDFVSGFRGFGRALRRTLGEWYTNLPANKLAYEVVKYQSRDGWSNADVLRLSHPVAETPEQEAIFRWVLGQSNEARKVLRGTVVSKYDAVNAELPGILTAFDALKSEKDAKKVIKTIEQYKLTREMIPTEFLTNVKVWEALLPNMPLNATVRNLGNMSKVGLLSPLSDASKTICARLRDQKYIKDSRLHPMAILVALKIYESGRGMKGDGSWSVVPAVVDALNDAFYLSFGNVEPTGKRLLFGVDVSGSMSWGGGVAGSPVTCAEAAAAMAMVAARTEQDYYIFGFADTFRDLKITAKDTLQSALGKTNALNFGGTDCALPMTWAKKNNVKADAFIVLTDSETWGGGSHPKEALKAYRAWSGIPAKQVVVGMTATDFTIADPSDPRTLDVVGFDTATPSLISEFIRS